ncbi:MAG: DUF4384 domain-containing protein [Pirellulaceae bacterium]
MVGNFHYQLVEHRAVPTIIRSVAPVAGLSQNNHAVQRHRTADGSYWKSFDFATSRGADNLFVDPINLKGAGSEMIFSLPSGLQGYFLATRGGVIRRDMWEDHFAEVAHQLGLGIPILPIDGNNHPTQRGADRIDITLSTSRETNTFAAGESLAIFARNNTDRPLFVEMIGIGAKGEVVVLVPAKTSLAAGQALRFPESGTLKVLPGLGSETITLFASTEPFDAGRIYRGENVADRYVHDFYRIGFQKAQSQVIPYVVRDDAFALTEANHHISDHATFKNNAARVTKHSITLQTR